jgi:hypothetical protein
MMFRKTSHVAVSALEILILGLSTKRRCSLPLSIYCLIADDEVSQSHGQSRMENYVFYWWGIPSGGDDLSWEADASIRADVGRGRCGCA